jgi:capsular polysaccharide biosynthesis protein
LTIPSREEAFAGPRIERLEAASSWVRPPADFVVDLSGGDIKHGLSEPRENHWHASYRNRFSDVLVFGHHHFHGFLGRDGRIDCQELSATQRRVETHLQYHPGRDAQIPQIHRWRGSYRARLAKLEIEKLDGTLYFGTPIEPDNWGMWLLEGIPNAIDFLQNPSADRFLAYIGRDWQRSLLLAVGIPEEKLVNQELGYTYHCDELVTKQFSHIDLVPTPLEKEAFRQVAHTLVGTSEIKPGRRLFLSRRTVTRETEGNYRALLNEDELVAAMANGGYEIVEPELLPFADQIRLFAEAELVVGLGGAALFNTVFSPPATRVISIESSGIFVNNHADLFAAMGHSYGIIFGKQDPKDETPVQKRWTIDVGGVMKALDRYE